MNRNGFEPEETSDARSGTLCSAFVDALPITGASVSVFGANGRQAVVCNSDDLAARLETLQFESGEGPHWEALDLRAPVICADLSAGVSANWPMFATGARDLDIRAVFAFPMMIGAALVGVVDLFSLEQVTLGHDFVRTARSLAARAAIPAVDLALASADRPTSVETPKSPLLRREVHQATGMIMAQTELSASEAFALLRARSFSEGIPIDRLARDFIDRRISFDDLTPAG